MLYFTKTKNNWQHLLFVLNPKRDIFLKIKIKYFKWLFSFQVLFLFRITQPDPRGSSSPEGPVQWSVPADEGTGGKQEEPQHGEAKVDAVRRVYAEQGQAAKHVDEKCACVNWEHREQTRGRFSVTCRSEIVLSAQAILGRARFAYTSRGCTWSWRSFGTRWECPRRCRGRNTGRRGTSLAGGASCSYGLSKVKDQQRASKALTTIWMYPLKRKKINSFPIKTRHSFKTSDDTQ